MNEYEFRSWDGEKFTYFQLFTDPELIYKDIQEYIGVKDKNGVKIYPGDIVLVTFAHKRLGIQFKPQKCLVRRRKNCPSVELFNIDNLSAERGLTFDNGMIDTIEVVGNIYQHKELLTS